MRRFCSILLVAICASCTLACQAYGQAAKGDKKAEEILRQMTDFYGKLPAFSCHAEAVFDMEVQQQKNNMVTKVTVRFQRPNKVAFIVDKGTMGLTTVTNGKEAVQYFPPMKRYMVREAPADLAGLFDFDVPTPITMLGMNGDWIPTSGEALFKNMVSGVTGSKYLGIEKVGDVDCHHCKFMQEEFDWDIWVEASKTPLVHRVSPDLLKQLAAAGTQLQGAKVSYNVNFSDWNVAPKFTDADFEFTPPKGVQRVDNLFAPPEEPPHSLLGQAAPAFATQDVDGHPIDLKKDLGKKVIMLDFWATWCGPCVQAMPQVDAVANQFAPKGLVFYAVNAGEDAATIKEFLKSSKMEVPVALDEKGEIGPLYGVEGIPQTVLIGKDGKVQAVHVGYNSQLGKVLAKEVEALLAGKDLASETIAKYEDAMKKQEASEDASPEANAAPDAEKEASQN